ncbi:lipoate--protein ligase [Spiroplasma endosymbiont of Aspidapion aeneum]|uniref:lipoate--protein ligase n=1 Tax=Spiroplasma endosymbiont of Aspidapion aeneum TaxID=3066276 RepID=UPI00313DC617
MINLIVSDSYDPAKNLAIEEFLTSKFITKDPILFIWQNENTIVVGRNQNTYAEINVQAALNDDVKIVRRNTGGGTVFQDLGNVCFSLIVNNDKNYSTNFELLLKPIINYLKQKGLNANFHGRNDIEIDGYKVSGNAQLQNKLKVLQHGTLLFDVDLSKIQKYLNIDKEKIKHQKVKSNIARVANIKKLLDDIGIKIDIKQFIDEVIKSYTISEEINKIDYDKNIVQELEKKYNSKDWVFQKNSDFDYTSKKYLENKGMVEVNIKIYNGIVEMIKFYGDFLGYKGTEELEQSLKNKKYEYDNLKDIFLRFDLKKIFGENFEANDLLSLCFN